MRKALKGTKRHQKAQSMMKNVVTLQCQKDPEAELTEFLTESSDKVES